MKLSEEPPCRGLGTLFAFCDRQQCSPQVGSEQYRVLPRREDRTRRINDLENLGQVTGNDRNTKRHGFEQHTGEAFSSRRQDERVRCAQEVRNVIPHAQKGDGVLQGSFLDHRLEAWGLRACAARNQDSELGDHRHNSGHGLDEEVQTLGMHLTPDGEHESLSL